VACVWVRACGYVRVGTCVWVCACGMRVCACVRACGGVCGGVWVGACGYVWVRLDASGCVWVHVGACGCVWVRVCVGARVNCQCSGNLSFLHIILSEVSLVDHQGSVEKCTSDSLGNTNQMKRCNSSEKKSEFFF